MSSPPIRLTLRQGQVLEALAELDTVAEIAEELGISQTTVQSHLRTLRQRFGVHSLHRLIVCAVREGALKIT